MANSSRENNFNIIRFVAAMMVILGHMCHLLSVNVNLLMGQEVSTIGVKIFFLISGYLIAQSFLNDSNILRYTIRRAFRILPGLIGVVLFAIFIVGPVFTSLPVKEYFSNEWTWAYLKNIVLYPLYNLPGVFENNPYPNAVNGSLWSLPVEVLMYIAVPVVFLIFRKVDKIKVAAFFAIILELANVAIGQLKPGAIFVIYGTNMISALAIVPYFFVGIIFLSPEVKKYLNLQLATGLLCIACMLNLSSVKTEIVLFFVLPYFIFSLAFAENPKFVKCFSKNDFSYGLYLYGFVIQQCIVKVLWKYQLTLNIYFVICSCATFFFSVMSWFLIEKPAQQFGKKLLKREKIAELGKFDIKKIE